MDRRVDLIGSLIVVAFGAWVLAVAATYPPVKMSYDFFGPTGLPILVGGTLVITGAVQAIRTARLLRTSGPKGFPEGTEDEPEYPSSVRRTQLIVAGAIAYLAAFTTLGYLIATPLAIVGGLWLFSYRTWWRLALVAVGYTIGAFIVFDRILSVPLPTGILTDLLVDLGLIDRIR